MSLRDLRVDVSASLAARERARDPGVLPRRDVAIVRGEGTRLWDPEGRAYLDFGASHGTNLVGHAHPEVADAIAAQARRLLHVAASWPNDVRAAYLDALAGVAPRGLARAFLVNSGAEAIEAALKFARGHTGCAGFVAAMRGFHGRTLGALSVTHRPEYRAPFEPLLEARHVPYGDEEALKVAVGPGTAALVLEPVQGEGGAHVPPPGYLRAARELCDDRGALLVADEVQTGFGRTGRFWGVDHEGIVPDILAFAKGCGGGFPMGGVLLREEVCTLPPLSHGSTFGGNPLACAAGLAVLRVLERDRLVERAERVGARLRAGLQEVANPARVREVRGLGLLVGLELRGRNAPLLRGLLQQGVLGLATGATVVRYLPPLTVTEAEVDTAVAATAKALAAGGA